MIHSKVSTTKIVKNKEIKTFILSLLKLSFLSPSFRISSILLTSFSSSRSLLTYRMQRINEKMTIALKIKKNVEFYCLKITTVKVVNFTVLLAAVAITGRILANAPIKSKTALRIKSKVQN